VWFCADSSVAGAGAFQEYSVHVSCCVAHTPDEISDEQAATLGTGLITAGVVLFKTLGLDMSDLRRSQSRGWILIWGGSGVTGVYLIQLAHVLGYKVICAASPTNHEYVTSLGADVVLDRWAPESSQLEAIRQATGGDVSLTPSKN
jgi:NADPH:quinone reductase-like Zn-dependent oxidoreductase